MNKTKYLQRDGRWGGLPYPKKPCYIRAVGCGEVSIANTLIEMKQYAQYTPATIQPYCKRYGAPGCEGTYLSGICAMMKHYGMTDVKECDTMPQLWAEMKKGNRVAVLLMGSRPGGSKKIQWTSGGHFIAAVDFKVEGNKHYLYIKDPWTDAKNHNGWLSYEEYLKGDVVGVYVGKTVQKEPAPKGKLAVDGIGGTNTIKATQKFFGTTQDGYLGDQKKKLSVYYPSITAVKYGKGKKGSQTVRALQKWLGLTRDGIIGKGTTAAWQKKLRDLGYLAKDEKIDGLFGVKSMKAWQRFLNDKLYSDKPPNKTSDKTSDKTPTLTDKIFTACKKQAEWMKNYKYGWESKPTIAKSKKKGTCVTYVACVLQRLGYLKSGQFIWHNEQGKVTHANSKMQVIYPEYKSIKSLKSKLKAGDILMAGKKNDVGSGSHIFVYTGKWSKSGKPYIYDNHSAERVKKGKSPMHTYSNSKKLFAIVRLKEG